MHAFCSCVIDQNHEMDVTILVLMRIVWFVNEGIFGIKLMIWGIDDVYEEFTDIDE